MIKSFSVARCWSVWLCVGERGSLRVGVGEYGSVWIGA